jgi:hypothetical protein
LHTPLLHTELTQSLAAPQVAPGWHGGHAPPQSRAVSVPFFTVSEHVGG